MKQKEIDKAAAEYAKEYWKEEAESINMEESIGYTIDNFITGANFTNQIWEEKTRWKSTSEEIPFNKWIIVKNADTYAAARVAGEIDLKFIRSNFTHWKEII